MTQLEFAFEFAPVPTQGNKDVTSESAEAAQALDIEAGRPHVVRAVNRYASVEPKGEAA